MKHFAVVSILVVIFTLLVNFLLQSAGLLPLEASTQAKIIDRLFNTHFWIISFLFSLITVLIVYSMIFFRQKNNDQEDAKFINGNNKLEIFWTIIPLGVVIFISFIGARSLADTRTIDPQALTVNVTAGQWYWSYNYPDFEITSDSLYLPVDRQVNLVMTSVDVIHSFWVPEFRVKQDVLPGKNLVKELRFTPTIIGDYTVRCAEFCGGAHAYMNSPVKVISANDFQDWVDSEVGAVPQDPVSKGQKLVTQNGCTGCHSLDGTDGVGPTWLGLFGEQQVFQDGTTALVDEVYLKNSIIKPNAEIVKGYPANVMPQSYIDKFNDDQIASIIAFIKSLK